MILNFILYSVVFLQIFFLIAAVYKYDILYRDEEMYTPCDIPNVKYLNELIDRSHLTYEFLSNDSIYIHGETTFLKDGGKQNNPITIEIFKKSRGEWIYTIYTIKHRDYCTALTDPTVFWNHKSSAFKNLTCPFYKGQKVYLNYTTHLTLTTVDAHFAGEYKIQNMVSLKELNEVYCYNIFVEIYRA